MFRSYRITTIAFGLICLWFASNSSAQQNQSPALKGEPVTSQQQEEAPADSEQSSQTENQTAIDPLPALNGIESAIRELIPEVDQDNRERDNQRSKDDLQAQQEMALWAKLMFVATAISVIVTFIGVVLIRYTLIYSRDAADSARKMVTEARKTTIAARATVRESKLATNAAERSANIQEQAFKRLERPYLYLRVVSTNNLQSPSQAVSPFLMYQIDNYGKTPAIFKSIFIELLPLEKMEWAKDKPRPRMSSDSAEWYEVIAPGKSLSINRSLSVKGGRRGQRPEDLDALALHYFLTYQDPMRNLYTDHVVMTYDSSSDSFRLDYSKSNPDETDKPDKAEHG